ncbi:hypothetical protein [Roseinatronobacter sp.]
MQATAATRWISTVITQADAAAHTPLPWSRSAKRARRAARVAQYQLAGAA